jgi:hypothetical protein
MENYTCINSKLYFELFTLGGDNLLAVYVKLKYAKRNSTKLFKEQNKSIYQTLREHTGLSITTLRRYIKVLSNEGFCSFDSQGNFCLVGGNKINKKYKSKKLVKIEIGTYQETKLFSFKVRILSMEKQQRNIIDTRDELNKINGRKKKNYRVSAKEENFYNIWSEKQTTDYLNKETYIAKTVLSNQGYSKLKFGKTKTKASGLYHKKKLVEAGIIKVRRKFKFLKVCTYKEYLYLKFNVDKSLVYKEGKLFKELIPEFTTTEFIKSSFIKKT